MKLSSYKVSALLPLLITVSSVACAVMGRKRFLHRDNELLHAALEGTPDGVLVKDLRGECLLMNSAAKQFFEVPTLKGYVCGAGFSEEEKLIALSGKAETTEAVWQEGSGTRHYGITRSPYRNERGEAGGIIVTIRDITEQKSSEEALRALNETLEQRVAERSAAAEQRARELARSRQELQKIAADLSQSNQDLQHFAYIASHDLQEPLRMVSSYLSLLSRRYRATFDKDANEFIDFSIDGAKRMKLLITELLNYSRVGTKTKKFREVDSAAVMQKALTNLKVAIEESGAQIQLGPLPKVFADDVQLGQILQNLLSNAIKFRSDTPPEIRVNARAENSQWMFSVQDNGIGFDTKHTERIFEIFQRLHSREQYPGTGVGLAICKKIVERHGGKIWADSAPGKGSTFHFSVAEIPVLSALESDISNANEAAEHGQFPFTDEPDFKDFPVGAKSIPAAPPP